MKGAKPQALVPDGMTAVRHKARACRPGEGGWGTQERDRKETEKKQGGRGPCWT